MTINIALIGLGRIGQLHAQNLAAHAGFHLAAVHDLDEAVTRKTAAQTAAAAAASAEDIFADSGIDAVFIASATSTHCRLIEQAVRAGKAVLCEKPLDLDIGAVRRCAEALAQYPQAVVQIGFNRRFDPHHAALISRARAGEIGRLEKLIITSRDPGLPSGDYLAASGGLFHDMMIHDFDMARAILPDEPQTVAAAGAALAAPEICEQAQDIDTAMVILQSAGGVMCHINCSRRAVYGYDQRIEVFGSDGMLISDNPVVNTVTACGSGQSAARAPLFNFFTDRYAESYRRQLDTFAAAVTAAVPSRPSFADGARALLLANAARAAYAGRQWQTVEAL